MPELSPWTEAVRFSLGRWRLSILVLAPVALILNVRGVSPLWAFGSAALAIVPLASLLGDATDELARRLGPSLGGLLNATLGNLTELIIGFLALKSGQIEVVKASITGSIIGNLLLVFGLAVFVGGLGREKQTFSRVAVGTGTSMLFLATVGLVMPAVFDLTVFGELHPSGKTADQLSLLTAGVLLLIYFSSLIFMFRTHRVLFGAKSEEAPRISWGAALAILVISSAMIALFSESLISKIEPLTRSLGWTDIFVGLVVLATVGNSAEHSAAVMMARRDKMDLALSISVGSSTQIALFVAPLLVVASQSTASPMSLEFHPLEIAAVIFSVSAVILVSMDGETNWFEGLQLIGVYIILAAFFFFVPASPR